MVRREPDNEACSRRFSLTITGGLILFTVILGTTSLGYIPMPGSALRATTLHLPTIIASILQGWPVGMVVGTVFGVTSLYMSNVPMTNDPLVALFPRILVGVVPCFAYCLMNGVNEYVRLAVCAVAGTVANTVLVLSMAVLLEYLTTASAIHIGLTYGLPEAVVAVCITVPAVVGLRKIAHFLE